MRDASVYFGSWLVVARRTIEGIGQSLARSGTEPEVGAREATLTSSDATVEETSDAVASTGPDDPQSDVPRSDAVDLGEAGKRFLRRLPFRAPISDKRAHLASFFLMAFVAAVAYRQVFIANPLVGVILLAASMQVLQSLTTTRNPDLEDLRGDVLGICLGTACAYVLVRLARRTLRPR